MGNKTKFSMPIDQILANHSGWSGVRCKTCRRDTTKAQYSYSMRYFKKPLCRFCQSIEIYNKKSYKTEMSTQKKGSEVTWR